MNNRAIYTETITRDAHEYTVSFYHDIDAECPLGLCPDEPIGYYVFDIGYYVFDEGDVLQDDLSRHGYAGESLGYFIDLYGTSDTDKVERAFNLWRTLTGSSYELVAGSGHGYSQGDSHSYYAIVTPWQGMTAEQIITPAMDEYSDWRYGNCWYLTASINDEVIDAVGDLIGDYDSQWIVEEYTAMIDSHYAEMTKQANLVGSGFVGSI